MSQFLDSALNTSLRGAESSVRQVQSSAESLLSNFYDAGNQRAFKSGWDPTISQEFPVVRETLFEDSRLSPATFSASLDGSLVSAQNQTIEQSFTNMIAAQHTFKANIDAFKVADETAQAALDMIA